MKRLIALAVLLTACNSVGPSAIEGARQPYNEAVVQTQNEQMLLNLVRLRYRDTPLFLEIGSVSTQYQFNYGGSAASSIDFSDSLREHGVTVGGSIGFSEKPTITYNPLQGDEFVKQLMSPIPLDTLVLLSRSGWSSERIMRACVQAMNGLPNAPTAAGPTPANEPDYKEFVKATKLIRVLQVMGEAKMSRRDDGFLYNMGNSEEAAELCRILNLTHDQSGGYAIIMSDSWNSSGISLYPRSLLSVLYYLSQGVQVPTEHENLGLVTLTVTDSGERFDWSELTGDLFVVHSSEDEPDRAFIKINYRGQWFYIDDADLNTKTTFGMLISLFSLQSGGRESISPALTLPIG